MEYIKWGDPKLAALRAKYEDLRLTAYLKAIATKASMAYERAQEETIDIDHVVVEDEPKLLEP